MPTFKITLAYDGTDFVGWQRQASGASIQGLLEDALKLLDERVTVIGAGRTDAGVHALGQVASFTLARSLTGDVVQRSLNANLPAAIRVIAVEIVPDRFHAQFSARGKTYRYRIWNAEVLDPFERGRVWQITAPLDVDAMRAAAARLEGRHDFAAFQGAGSDVVTTVRTITSSRIAVPHSALIVYEISGDGFLRHMVRAIAGTLVEIGRGRRPADWISDVLSSRDRSAAGQTAPAEGLFLVAVHY